MRRVIVAGLVVCVKRLVGDRVPMERLVLRLTLRLAEIQTDENTQGVIGVT
jgi:hypothetical protein